MSEQPTSAEREAMSPDQFGIMGPGRSLYESYRAAWAIYKHPLPEWKAIGYLQPCQAGRFLRAGRPTVEALCAHSPWGGDLQEAKRRRL
jgi:hypothetical protein